MSAFEEHREDLEHYETMMGEHRGRLAVTLDRLTEALILIGQHTVYCHNARDASQPPMDVKLINKELLAAKELVQSVMEELRISRERQS